jgi:hypothetical protein
VRSSRAVRLFMCRSVKKCDSRARCRSVFAGVLYARRWSIKGVRYDLNSKDVFDAGGLLEIQGDLSHSAQALALKLSPNPTSQKRSRMNVCNRGADVLLNQATIHIENFNSFVLDVWML